jgi:prolipoprotein diacylglyceryltransferase
MNFELPDIHLLYAIPILFGLLLGLLYPVAQHITDPRLRRQYYWLQLITFVSAIIGAKLVFLFAEYRWPIEPITDWQRTLYTGRSIVGALIFGFLGAEIAKPLVGYRMPPNDRFAALLPFSLAIGRVGCLLNGCCRGVPYDGLFSIVYADGIPRHPAQLYEIAFQVCAGVGAIFLVKHQWMMGCVFSLYLICYGVFRFLIEFIRETPKSFGPLSAYQWLSVLMVGLGASFLVKRRYFRPAIWEQYAPSKPLAASVE